MSVISEEDGRLQFPEIVIRLSENRVCQSLLGDCIQVDFVVDYID